MREERLRWFGYWQCTPKDAPVWRNNLIEGKKDGDQPNII